jgi:glycosyltransferase involved in cell wall biosynthesis
LNGTVLRAGDILNILFLTLSSMEDIEQGGIYTDLVRELASTGINMYVISPREKRANLTTELIRKDNIHILLVRTGNITKTSFVEKGISTITIERQYLAAINRYFKGIHFDMVMYATPPITFEKIVRHFKDKHNSRTYLMLKDIFPQNAVDMGLMKPGSLIYRYFRKKEQKIYAISDYIGCMSPANVAYVLKNNPEIDEDKVELFPNTIKVMPHNSCQCSYGIREKLGIPTDKIVFVFGGNLGIPQGIDFLVDCIYELRDYKQAYFVVVGDGTERDRIEAKVNQLQLNNLSLLRHLPKADYDRLMLECDVGLVCLDKRFTIPNYPSRTLAYMDMALPILAATDNVSDIRVLLNEAQCGLWAYSGDKEGFKEQVRVLCEDRDMRIRMGQNGRRYLEENFDVSRSVEIISRHLDLV